MARNPEHRDLFPGALEIMILQSLRLKPMHGTIRSLFLQKSPV